jgi:hypothetical protein
MRSGLLFITFELNKLHIGETSFLHPFLNSVVTVPIGDLRIHICQFSMCLHVNVNVKAMEFSLRSKRCCTCVLLVMQDSNPWDTWTDHSAAGI